jgi:hypothetical protein
MKTLFMSFLIGVLIFTSCIRSKPSNSNNENLFGRLQLPYMIDLEKNLNNVRLVALSEIGKEIEYITLETKSNCLIRKIKQIEFSPQYIFISDSYKLLQFKRNGKFVRQIGDNGRGPGEYLMIPGFCVNNSLKKIYIIAWGINSVLEYDYDGNFLRAFKQSFDAFQFLINESDKLAFYIPNDMKTIDSDNVLILTDTTGKIVTKITNHHRKTSKGLVVLKTSMSYYKKSIIILEPGVDTLKQLNKDKLEPYAIFNLGYMKMKPNPDLPYRNPEREYTLNQLKQKLWITNVNENNQYLFLKLDFGLSDSSTFFLFNKTTFEITHLENDGFKNDLDGGITFWPQYMYNDSILIDYCDAYVLINHFRNENPYELEKKYGDKYSQLEKLVERLEETSNPVLMVLK